ncbi:MAG: glycosyltransferase [Candidatus Hydrogenedentes bacterium]|nr:glycosyltransferase [Candidatus Hydrogenedentota bacterium]
MNVSILMPVFNAQETLGNSIESIRGQSWTDWELILVDDGSTDDSGQIGANFANRDSRIHNIRKRHEGIVAALTAAADRAEGRYLARMDADDTAHPDRLAKQLTLVEQDPRIALCGTRVEMVGSDLGLGRQRYEKWINSLCSHEEILRELFVECPLSHPTFMMRRDTFEAVGGYQDHGWAEDYDLCMRLFLAGARFGKVPEPLLLWRDSPERLSMNDDRYSFLQFRRLKRHYLFKSYLKAGTSFFQWGAGEVGKYWLREWGQDRPEAVVDIHPRKVGRRIHGYHVIAPEELPGPGAAFIVVAVGAPGARNDIRNWLNPKGYEELRDYLFLA